MIFLEWCIAYKLVLIIAAAVAGLIIIISISVGIHKRKKRNFEPHFRKFHEAVTQNHPQYVYGKSKKKYKTVGLTESAFTDTNNIPLDTNPEPGNTTQAYFLPRPNRIPIKARSKRLDGWGFKTERDKKNAKKISRRIPRRRKYPSKKGKKK